MSLIDRFLRRKRKPLPAVGDGPLPTIVDHIVTMTGRDRGKFLSDWHGWMLNNRSISQREGLQICLFFIDLDGSMPWEAPPQPACQQEEESNERDG